MSLTDPILVEVLRGDSVECVHRGALVVLDAAGRVVFSVGDIEQAIYPRSAIKALQALPLVESGAADRYGFGHAELALACSSHSGEPRHAETAAAMLAKAGLTEATLECGAHWPSGASATQGLARSGGKPSALHNNCSGKHSGFVCFACQEGINPTGYVGIDHKVQRFVAEAVGEVTGHRLDRETAFGIDGCSIPTFAVPLKKLAHGFAKLATGEGVGPERAKAFARLRAACAAEPFMVAGSGRFCTDVMGLFGERVFVKTGAEGVFCAALPGQGLGVALKCLDGASRASEVMMATLIAKLVPMDEAERAKFQRFVTPVMKNWNGITVGGLRPTFS
ncbi:asparaginase [Phreatobacter oligotrophus]|uniref:Asparaginase n=1 Tax=Phreatobacter oligotrophus TaxID=1122261 RepID=A0A2T4ZFQ1_9HYPH|nr:asparaginase [Phreatobacter oligotrophus]PTM60752.1 asparaginase [Phreatobacter oligotrophus]